MPFPHTMCIGSDIFWGRRTGVQAKRSKSDPCSIRLPVFEENGSRLCGGPSFFVVALERSRISFDVRATEVVPWMDAYCIGSGVGNAVSRRSVSSVRVRETVARRDVM